MLTLNDHHTSTQMITLPKFTFTHAKLYKDFIIYIKERIYLCMVNLNTSEITDIGWHDDEIVAMDVSESTIVTIDRSGSIYIWKNLQLGDRIRIQDLENLSDDYKNIPYFEMGYPYLLKVSRSCIAFSTDHGILVIRSLFLTNN